MIPLAIGFGGPYDLLIVGGLVLLLFGGSKIAGFGKSAGEGIKEFKKAMKDEDSAADSPPIEAKKVAKDDGASPVEASAGASSSKTEEKS
jgi:sec-independent protein translocase protein TatA